MRRHARRVVLLLGVLSGVATGDIALHVTPGRVDLHRGTQSLYIVATSTPGMDQLIGSIGFDFDTTGAGWAALDPTAFAWVPAAMNDPASWFALSGLPDPVAVAFSPGTALLIPDGEKVTIAELTVTPNSVGPFSLTLGVHSLTDELASSVSLIGSDVAALTLEASDFDCCVPRDFAGCNDPGVVDCVCAVQPECCLEEWSCTCVALAGTLCGNCGSPDCNQNAVPDRCDVSSGNSFDCNVNAVPDECETPPLCATCVDCDQNLSPDECDRWSCAAAMPVGTTWTEVGDAGLLRVDAQVVSGNGPLHHITGDVFSGDVDMYLIAVTDPIGFSASTVGMVGGGGGSATFDSQLHLFDLQGIGVLGNDDQPGSLLFQSTIESPADDDTGASPAAGLYYLAVSGFGDAPVSQLGRIFSLTSFTEISGPDGVGGEEAILGWSGGASAGDYDVFLTGASFVSSPVFPCDCNANGAPDVCDIGAGTSDDADVNGIPDECEFVCVADMDCQDADLCTVDQCGLDGFCRPQPMRFGDVNNDGVAGADDANCLLDDIEGMIESLACCDRLRGSCTGPNDTFPPTGFENRDLAPCPSVGDPLSVGDSFIGGDDLNAVLDTIGGVVPNSAVSAACLACNVAGSASSVYRWDRSVAPIAHVELSLVSSQKTIRPGGQIRVDVYAGSLVDLRTYQLTLAVETGREGSLLVESVLIDVEHEDYVFAGHATVMMTGRPNRVMLNTFSAGGVAVADHAYLGTFVLRASKDARGPFAVGLSGDGTTLLRSADSEVIAFTADDVHVTVEDPGRRRPLRLR